MAQPDSATIAKASVNILADENVDCMEGSFEKEDRLQNVVVIQRTTVRIVPYLIHISFI